MSGCHSEAEYAGIDKTLMLSANINKLGNGSLIGSSEERVALLKAGFNSRDIESV